jgi:hypothetical protein
MPQACTNVIAAATRNGRRGVAVDKADPIFALIERHREAVAAYYKSLVTPHADINAPWDAMHLAQYAMDDANPTTLAGMVAYLNHVADDGYVHSLFGEDDETNEQIRKFIHKVRDALKAMLAAA